jgi:hypothetical protein
MGELISFINTAERLYAIADSIPPRQGFGTTYLQPFVEVMNRLDPELHGIARKDIAAVRQAYMNLEDWGWEGGFLVELADGRRAMIDISAEDFAWDDDDKTKMTVELKPADFDYMSPELPRDHSVRLYGFVDELPDVALFLERLAAA